MIRRQAILSFLSAPFARFFPKPGPGSKPALWARCSTVANVPGEHSVTCSIAVSRIEHWEECSEGLSPGWVAIPLPQLGIVIGQKITVHPPGREGLKEVSGL